MDNLKEDIIEDNIIKHIVISGGGLTLFTYYGILKMSSLEKLWDINNIQTIYGTSAGAILSVVLCLKYDWSTLDDYIINRPWEKVFNIDMYSIFDIFNKKGLFNISVIEEIFKSLFLGKDIDLNITFQDFYNLTNIELHLFTTDLNNFQYIDVSYKTHPDWRVLDIVYSSAAVPIIFTPLFIHDKCLIDGGIFTNSPIKQCVNNEGLCNEILSIIPNKNNYNNIVNDCTLLDYIIFLLDNLITIVNNENTITTKLQYYTDIVPVSINHIMDIISSKEKRSALIEKGCNIVSSSL
tara:strand:- start:1319 stop:2200 length:882 start_codon:yes stop_codon:yes gene_type:complete